MSAQPDELPALPRVGAFIVGTVYVLGAFAGAGATSGDRWGHVLAVLLSAVTAALVFAVLKSGGGPPAAGG